MPLAVEAEDPVEVDQAVGVPLEAEVQAVVVLEVEELELVLVSAAGVPPEVAAVEAVVVEEEAVEVEAAADVDMPQMAHLDPLVRMEIPVVMANLDNLVEMVNQDQEVAAEELPPTGVSIAIPDQLVQPETQEDLANPVALDNLEPHPKAVAKDPLDHPVHLDPQAAPANLEDLANPAVLDNSTKFPAQKVHLDPLAVPANPETMVNLETQEIPELPVNPDQLEMLEDPAALDQLETQVAMGKMVGLEAAVDAIIAHHQEPLLDIKWSDRMVFVLCVLFPYGKFL
jgi:hypothetical protein